MFKKPYRVYYEDTDAGGIMYYANYLKFAERARSDWLREIGCARTEAGVTFVIRKVNIEYFAPARLDDEILTETSLQNIGSASINMKQEFFIGETKIASADVLVVCVDENIKPTRVPEQIRKQMSN